MYRKVAVVTIFVLLLSLAFASVSFAQTGTGNQGNTQNQTNQSNNRADQAQGGTWDSAFTSPGGARALRAGQQQWFAFQYAGDNSPIQIRLRNATNLQFSVWTQQDIQNAAGNFGMTANPVGRSTANEQFGGDQYWTGSFNTPGTYYVMVENASGGQGGNYALEVTGSGVNWRGNGQGNNASGSNGTSSAGNNNSSASTSGTGSNTSGSNDASGNNTNSSTSAQGGVAPSTLPTTGGEMASVFPMLLGGMGALSVAAGALLRRKK